MAKAAGKRQLPAPKDTAPRFYSTMLSAKWRLWQEVQLNEKHKKRAIYLGNLYPLYPCRLHRLEMVVENFLRRFQVIFGILV